MIVQHLSGRLRAHPRKFKGLGALRSTWALAKRSFFGGRNRVKRLWVCGARGRNARLSKQTAGQDGTSGGTACGMGSIGW